MRFSFVGKILGFDFAAALAAGQHGTVRHHKAKIVTLVVVLVALWVAQTYARSTLLVLSRDHPLVLVALDAKAHNLVLVADRIPTEILVALGTLSRFVDHFLYYLLGRWMGEPAFAVVRQQSGRAARVVRRAEKAFARAGNLAVFALSNRPVSVLAGAALMSPARFICLHLPGTLLRVWVAVLFAKSSSHVLRPWLTTIEDNANTLTVFTVAATGIWIGFLAYTGRRRAKAAAVEEEPGDPTPEKPEQEGPPSN